MARKSKFKMDPEPRLDMTTMIDIVFNLLIFFMIVSDLNNLTVEQVELPYADQAEKPKPGRPVEKILQVNILRSGLIKVRGSAYTTDPQLQRRYPALVGFLELEAAGYEREDPDPANPGNPASKMRINIRADRNVPFKHVQGVFDACVRNVIYKTSLAATQDSP